MNQADLVARSHTPLPSLPQRTLAARNRGGKLVIGPEWRYVAIGGTLTLMVPRRRRWRRWRLRFAAGLARLAVLCAGIG